MRKYPTYQIDAFTDQMFGGNPAGVMLDADSLSEAEMQVIARELNNSETAFVLSPDGDDHDIRIRFFTPTTEVPSCGHATVSAHYARAKHLGLKSTEVVHKIGIGCLPVSIVFDGSDYTIQVTQGRPEIRPPFERSEIVPLLVSALNIEESDLNPALPIQFVDTGNSKVIIPVKDRNILNSLKPDMQGLLDLNKRFPCSGFYVFTMKDPDLGATAHARNFAPQIGIPEDPVTGNGAGPLGAYLVSNALIKSEGNIASANIVQGEAINRRGNVGIKVTSRDGIPERVQIEGRAVVAFETILTLD